jgi:hypothetical protein
VFFTRDKVDDDGYPVRDRHSSCYVATFEPAAVFADLMKDVSLQTAVYAEIEGGTGGDALTRVKLADCGNHRPGSCWQAWRPRSARRRRTHPLMRAACSSSPTTIRPGSRGGPLPARSPLRGRKTPTPAVLLSR